MPRTGHTVLMVEQQVRHTEHTAALHGAGPAPAPMVERAFRLLDLLSVSEEGLTLSDLARALEMSKGSIHGLLKTLEQSAAIEQTEDRRYVLGPHIYDLAQAYVQHAGLRRFALPAMRRLAASIGETIFLGRVEHVARGTNGMRRGKIYHPDQALRIIECVEAEGVEPSLHISAARGTCVHLLAGATGRLILANWPVAQREEFLRVHPLPRFTEHSIIDPQRFLAAVDEAGRTGIGVDHEEYLIGVNAVAAPIYGPGRTLVALLWVAGFTSRFDDEAMHYAGQQLRTEAAAISQSLGSGSSDQPL
jgi:IclR family acetate operon transcriptional repressor